MNFEFTTKNDVLQVSFNDEEVFLTESNGIISPTPNLFSLVTDENGVLDAVNRIPPKPTSPLGVLWNGLCTIYEYKDSIDPITFQTTYKLTTVIVNEPCRVSYSRETTTNVQNGVAEMTQITMLFIRPDLDIKAGSVIEVTQNGRTLKYKSSSKTALYSNHQEVVLELYEDKA